MSNILITVKKEIRSFFRDKKTLPLLLIYPILIPMMVILYGSIYENVESDESVYTIGINYELNDAEKQALENNSLEYKTYNSMKELEEAYDKDEIAAYLTYDNESKTYMIYIDTSSTSGMSAYGYIYSYLETYSTILTNEYLIEQNVNLEEAYNTFVIEETNLSTNNYMVIVLFGVALTYVILSICIATGNMAINATATEKENGTLETLLTFPIKKTELIIGKYLSSVVVGFLTSLVSLLFLFISLYIAKDVYLVYENVSITISVPIILSSLITVIAASTFISGVALLLTAFARNYKEAQGKISLINILAILPMFVSILEVTINHTYYLIPVCNYVQILNDLLLNNMDIINVGITFISSIVYTIIIISFIIKVYNSEDILFSN